MNAKINLNERNFINQIVSGTRDRERKIMLISGQNCTSPDSFRDIPGPGGPVEETLE